MNGVKLGVSAAASWAWGTSLIVGMEIAQTKGLAAWGIWATANAATLAVFGALIRSGLLARHVFDAKGIKAASSAGVAGSEEFICVVWELPGAEGLAQRLPDPDCGRSEKAFPAGASHAKRDKPEHEKRRPLRVGGGCGLRPKGN